MSKFAVQLWSMRDIAEKDLLRAIDVAGEMGWDGVEFAGFFDIPAQKVKEHLQKWNLTPISSHVKFPLLWEHLDEVLAYHKELGVQYIICPNAADWSAMQKTVEMLDEIRKKVEDAGFAFLYHNHNHEFVPVEGVRPVDLIAEKGLLMELDVFWAWVAGTDVVKYICDRGETIRFLHVKDGNLKKDTPRGGKACALGRGLVPLEKILQAARRIGIDDWFIYENDDSENSAEQARASLELLHSLDIR